MSKLALRKRSFKGGDIRRICATLIGTPDINSHPWRNWHQWINGILNETPNGRHYWVNGDRAILLISIALIRKQYPYKELSVDEVRSMEPKASKILESFLKYLDEEYVIGREVQEFLAIRGKKRSWTTIRNRIPGFSYKKAYKADLILAMVS